MNILWFGIFVKSQFLNNIPPEVVEPYGGELLSKCNENHFISIFNKNML